MFKTPKPVRNGRANYEARNITGRQLKQAIKAVIDLDISVAQGDKIADILCGVRLNCEDCGCILSPEDAATYRMLGGEPQAPLKGRHRRYGLCSDCLKVRQEEDDFTAEDFAAEFGG